MSYKSLILIDNSISMGEGNLAIARAIVKYLVENSDQGNEICVGTFGDSIELVTDYGASLSEVLEGLNDIRLSDRNTYVTDTVLDVLYEWKENDFASRNLVIITDGGEAASPLHADEELYHLLEEVDYPVYCIGCMEAGTKASRNLSAIASISGGKMVFTEYEDSEAGVDVEVGDAILTQMTMDDFSSTNDFLSNEENTNNEAIYYEGEVYDSANYNQEFLGYELQDGVVDSIYQEEQGIEEQPSINTLLYIAPAVIVVLFAVIIIVVASAKKKNRAVKRNDYYSQEPRAEITNSEHYTKASDHYTKAMATSLGETRLLSQSMMSHDITFEDANDPTKFFRTSCIDSIVIGRAKNTCDVVIDYDDSVSGRHCEILCNSDMWFIRDLGSLNGTRVNRKKVYQEMEIHSGDMIQLGRVSLVVAIR